MTQNSYIATINYVENTYSSYIAIYIAVDNEFKIGSRKWSHQLKVHRETRVVNTSPIYTRCNPYFGRIIQSDIDIKPSIGIKSCRIRICSSCFFSFVAEVDP